MDKHNLIDKLIFSPRVNLLYKPAEDFQARLTYSTGFRAPQAYDEDLHVTAVGGEGVQIKLVDNLLERELERMKHPVRREKPEEWKKEPVEQG